MNPVSHATMTACSADAPTGFPLRRLLMDYRYIVLLNLGCGLAASYVFNSTAPLLSNLIEAMCIGTLAYLFIFGTRLALWRGAQRPHWLTMTIIAVLGGALGQVAGLTLSRMATHRQVPALTALHAWNPLVTLMITAGAAYFYYNRGRIARLQATAAEERARTEVLARQAMQAQLQMLQAQIEPHMLFNTLANLQGLIAIDPPRAQLLLDHLIQYLRATLGASRAGHATLAQEFALMQSYLQVMAVRMDARLSFSLTLPDALGALHVPPMLLQPLVENAIQHGLEPKVEGGHVTVSAARIHNDGGDGYGSGDVLRLTVSDTGLGLDHPDQPGHGTRLALSNIRARLDALYGPRASFTLSAGQPCGAVAVITLPLESA
ncbi:sensor histidine kinase [Rugamonas sp.]|uniref:sensor histidine kinase n=1 Tax=Rugamonas sp. TaxID=1926287 RepID=UPI0025D3D091|nr:histidine kinase [Rugamonas sp.]